MISRNLPAEVGRVRWLLLVFRTGSEIGLDAAEVLLLLLPLLLDDDGDDDDDDDDDDDE